MEVCIRVRAEWLESDKQFVTFKSKKHRDAFFRWIHDLSFDHRTPDLKVRSLVNVNKRCFHICFHTSVDRL